MEPGDDLCLVLCMVWKKRDSLGQYDKFKYSFYVIGITKKVLNAPIEHQPEWKLILHQIINTVYVACWPRLCHLNSPKSSCSLISVSSYILCGKESNIHWIHWYCKCVLGTDLCSFVKSIWLSPSALLHGFVLLSCILFPSRSTSSLYSRCCIS